MEKINKEYLEDLRWGEKHHTNFLEKYRDQWVAIIDKKVIAAGENLSKVKEEARKKSGKEKIPVMFVECGEHIYNAEN